MNKLKCAFSPTLTVILLRCKSSVLYHSDNSNIMMLNCTVEAGDIRKQIDTVFSGLDVTSFLFFLIILSLPGVLDEIYE